MTDYEDTGDTGATEDDSENLWIQFLEDAKRGDTGSSIPQSTLFVVGNPQNGKSSMLKKWKNRITSDTNIPEYILDFSYCNVIDTFDEDSPDDTLVSRMGIWQLDDDAHANLLPTLTRDAKRVGFIITLDLSKPENLMESFDKWLKVYQDTCQGLITGGSELEKELKLKISKYVQTFVDATKKVEKPVIEMVEQTIDPETGAVKDVDEDEKEATESEKASEEKSEETAEAEKPAEEEGGEKAEEAGDGEAPASDEKDEILLDVPIDPDYPKNNYGIPLFVVGLKGDFFANINQIGATDKFDFLTGRLRKKCLDWGATLIYTSAAGEGVNAEVMVDQVYHRLFNFPLLHAPKVVGSSTDYAIHVPAGYDKLSLIELSESKKWDDSTHLKKVFGKVGGKTKAEKKKQTIQAKEDSEFFASLQEQLKTGVRRVDPNARKSDTKKKKEKAVKSFFKSLLSKE